MKIADHIVSAEPVHPGSTIYKAKRRGGGYVAIQLFAFHPIDKQYSFFEEQVDQLTRAFEEYNTAVPRVLNHGLTKNSSLAFVEMEWIEGTEVDETESSKPVLSIEEISRMAEQMASVLTYCQKLALIHGHISKGNIIWHKWRKRYVLTGFRFGLKEKTNIPEKGNHLSFFKKEHKKDIHDFGIVLLELTRSLTTEELKNKSERTLVPEWMVTLIEKCITENKESFSDASEVYDYILQHYKTPLHKDWYRSKPQQPSAPTSLIEKASLIKPKFFTRPKKNPLQGMRFVLDRQIVIGLIIAALLAGLSIFAQKKTKGLKSDFDEVAANSGAIQMRNEGYAVKEKDRQTISRSIVQPNAAKINSVNPVAPTVKKKEADTIHKDVPANQNLGSYKVRSTAYFYNQPNERTRRNAFIVHWNNAVLHPLKEENDFVYIVFTNDEGQTSKGWLRKQDLIKLSR